MDEGDDDSTRRYAILRASVSGSAAEATGSQRIADEQQGRLFVELPPELELQSLFFAGDFGRRFQTTDGRSVEVIQFGHWNHADGPDFCQAVVALDGERQCGSIEMDIDVRGWEQHGHSTNPAYEDVVLHVSFQGPAARTYFVRTAAHREVPSVRLTWPPSDGVVGSRRDWLPEAKAGRCSAPLEHMEAERIEALLRAAARFRLEEKAKRLRRGEELRGWKQAVYEGLAEALGYARNRVPMRVLSQRLPIALLRRESRDAEALLFGGAGFLEGGPPSDADDEARTYLRDLWARWWKRRGEWAPQEGRRPAWQLSGSRPVNHPQRRLGALGVLVEQWPDLVAILDPDRAFATARFATFLEGLDHPFWSWHHTLSSRRSSRRLALVGESRTADLLANVVFPFRLAYDSGVRDAYEALPARLENVSSRRALLRLFGARSDAPRFARLLHQQQGLLQIYQDFCLADRSDCAECPFPEQLRQWT